MGFLDDLAEVACHPDLYKLALRRTGSPDRAGDALQQTYWAVARAQSPEPITRLYFYFRRALINEINHQLSAQAPIPVRDLATLAESDPERGSPGSAPPPSVESEAARRLLTEKLLRRLDESLDKLTACVPTRSGDPRRYQAAIVSAARMLLSMLLEGPVTREDWNAVLKSAYPSWCEEPGLDRGAIDQRLSRARRDATSVLRRVVLRAELAT